MQISSLAETSHCYELIGQPKRTPKTFEPASADALMVLTLRLCRLALSESVAPDKVELAHNPGTCLGVYQTYFGCTVVPNATRYALVFNKALMEQILPGANPLLARINDDAVRDYLARYELADFATQVRRLLIETLTESGSDQAAIARELNVSVRQLQRELQERGLTFKTLVEEVRHELAISYLTEKQKSIGEITYLLRLHRACQLWPIIQKMDGSNPGRLPGLGLTAPQHSAKGWSHFPTEKFQRTFLSLPIKAVTGVVDKVINPDRLILLEFG